MKSTIEILKLLQPFVIGLLIFFVFFQDKNHDTYIEDKQNEFLRFQDSVKNLNDSLYKDITNRDIRIDSVEIVNGVIDSNIITLDKSIEDLTKKLDYEVSYIDGVDANVSVDILSGNLSKIDGD